MKNIKREKIKDCIRICDELGCPSIKDVIIEKINSLDKIEKLNLFDTAKEILNLENGIKFKKEVKVNKLKYKVNKVIENKYGDLQEQFNIMNDFTDEFDKQEYINFVKSIKIKEKNIKSNINLINNIKDIEDLEYEI